MIGRAGLLIGCLLFALPGAAAAQRAVLAGVVMDTAGKPLEAAEINAFKTKIRASTDAGGRFMIAGLSVGREVFQVRRIGYQAQVFDLEFVRGDTLRVGITLARDSVQVLPEVGVVVPKAPSPGERLEREAIERILYSGAPTSALIPRSELAKVHSGRIFPLLLMHGLKSRMDRQGKDRLACPRDSGTPVVYLDGARMARDFSMESITPDHVEKIEVYRSSSARPTQYTTTGSGCTVLIWTRR